MGGARRVEEGKGRRFDLGGGEQTVQINMMYHRIVHLKHT